MVTVTCHNQVPGERSERGRWAGHPRRLGRSGGQKRSRLALMRLAESAVSTLENLTAGPSLAQAGAVVLRAYST
jgi:hypothetical protein